jgi:hypothetical protein
MPSEIQPTAFFSQAEKEAIQGFWNSPGVYQTEVLPQRAILSVEGSTWLFDFYRARGQQGKLIPTRDPQAESEQHKRWDAWIDQRYALDEWLAEAESAAKRGEEFLLTSPTDPGDAPADMVALAGMPPRFVKSVSPRLHRVRFSDLQLRYEDHVPMRRKYAYYRFNEGVMDVGQHARDLSLAEKQRIFRAAGLSESDLRVMVAVSLLEGGFDSVNTYDTGFVSVGVIQFASLSAGAGSLGQVLLDYLREDPIAFQNDFRQYGLSVTPKGRLVALRIDTLDETIGPGANLSIIRDPRLIAVFARAGRLSFSFRVSQVRVAQRMYHPGNDPISISLGGQTITAKVSDFIRSEAGIATLMDRKVNTGNLGNLQAVVQEVMVSKGFTTFTQLRSAEREILQRMKYRKDYLQDPALSQPL